MKQQKYTKQFAEFLDIAIRMYKTAEAEALLVYVDGAPDWEAIKKKSKSCPIIVAADKEKYLAGAEEFGINTVVVELEDSPILERLTHALVESVAADILGTGARVVAIYSGFEEGRIDTLSLIRLEEHLGRLTSRDLRQLETSVPLETLKIVVDLAVDIGRDGREGKPVGTMFVVGDQRKVLANSAPTGFDPIKGYSRKERNISDARVREGLREVAQLDGAFVIAPDGTVEAACRLIDVSSASVTLSKGPEPRSAKKPKPSPSSSANRTAPSASSKTAKSNSASNPTAAR